MSLLDKMKVEVDLAKCRAAQMERLMQIEERKEDIARIEAHIEILKTNELELKEKLKKFALNP